LIAEIDLVFVPIVRRVYRK